MQVSSIKKPGCVHCVSILLTDVSLKGCALRRSTIGLVVFTSALLLLAFAPSVAVALEVTISAQSNDGDAWKCTFSENGYAVAVYVEPGDYLIFSNASGTWGEGDSEYGPEGSTTLWPDNFLNLTDLGVGPYEATTPTPYWDALVGYIGSSPPARGDYTFLDVGPEAERVFPVFPYPSETTSVLQVKEGGRLCLAFNADAYSNYTVDNWGEVNVFVEQDTNSRQSIPDLELLCKALPNSLFAFKVACLVGNQFVGGEPTWRPTSGGDGQPIPQEQVPWGQLGGTPP